MIHRILGLAATGMLVCALSIDAGGGAKTKDTKDTKPAAKATAAATGSIDVYKNKDGKYRFAIKNADGKTIAMPLPAFHTETKEECLAAIEALKQIINSSKPTEVKKD